MWKRGWTLPRRAGEVVHARHREIEPGGGEDGGVGGAEGGDHHRGGDPASAAGEAPLRHVGGDELGLGHLVNGQHIGVGDVHEEVDGGDDEHAPEQAERDVALRLLHFAGDVGELVPAVVGPEGALERRHDAGDQGQPAQMNGGARGGEIGGARRRWAAGTRRAPAAAWRRPWPP